jgi:hypothetical protein
MNYTQTHAKIKDFEKIFRENTRPADVAAVVIEDPELIEAVAALVKQYQHDPRISRRARQWSDKIETCFERVSGGYVTTNIHPVHIAQTAEAIDAVQAAKSEADHFCNQAENYLRAIKSAVKSVGSGSTMEKGYLLEKLDLFRALVERSL